jgi:hypothetical protein
LVIIEHHERSSLPFQPELASDHKSTQATDVPMTGNILNAGESSDRVRVLKYFPVVLIISGLVVPEDESNWPTSALRAELLDYRLQTFTPVPQAHNHRSRLLLNFAHKQFDSNNASRSADLR